MAVATPAATTNSSLLLAFPDAPSYSPVHPSTVSFSLDKPRVVVRGLASSSPKLKGEPRGITKPLRVSEELQSLVDVPEIPRPHALKRIWAYIKDNKLRVPSHTRNETSSRQNQRGSQPYNGIGHNMPSIHAATDDEMRAFSRTRSLKNNLKYEMGSSKSDAEIEYRRGRSLRENIGGFRLHA